MSDSTLDATTLLSRLSLQTRSQNSPSTLLALPTELLIDIIRISVFSSSRRVGSLRSTNSASRAAVSISLTCHHLREIALACPDIWAYLIDFTTFREDCCPMAPLQQQCFLKRSRDALLELDHRNYGITPFAIQFEMKTENIIRTRLYAMTMSEASNTNLVLQGLGRHLPKLEALILRVPGYDMRIGREFRPFTRMLRPLQKIPDAFEAPKLQELVLVGCLVNFSSGKFRNLAHLWVSNIFPLTDAPTVAKWLSVIAAASTTLRTIVLVLAIKPVVIDLEDSLLNSDGTIPSPTIHLPFLEQISIASTQWACFLLLCQISLPRLNCGAALELSNVYLDGSLDYLMKEVVAPRMPMRKLLLNLALNKNFIQVKGAGDTDVNTQLVLKLDAAAVGHDVFDYLANITDAFAAPFSRAILLKLDHPTEGLRNGAQSTNGEVVTQRRRLAFVSFFSKFTSLESIGVDLSEALGLLNILRMPKSTAGAGSILLPSLRHIRIRNYFAAGGSVAAELGLTLIWEAKVYQGDLHGDDYDFSTALLCFATWRSELGKEFELMEVTVENMEVKPEFDGVMKAMGVVMKSVLAAS